MKRLGMLVIGAWIALAGTAAAQSAPLSIEQMQQLSRGLAQLTPGFETWLHEFVEDGERPNDESLEFFLGDIGFSSHLTPAGWRWFDVPYGSSKTSVHVKMDDTGRSLLLRLDLTRIEGGRATQTLTTTLLANSADGGPGVFKTSPEGVLSLYTFLDAKAVNDVVLRKAIDMVIARAERTAPLWKKR
jgi:hypothetical protein